jgi:hypothetical protein
VSSVRLPLLEKAHLGGLFLWAMQNSVPPSFAGKKIIEQ